MSAASGRRFRASHVTVNRLYEVRCETCNEMIDELLHSREEADESRRIHIEAHRTDPEPSEAFARLEMHREFY